MPQKTIMFLRPRKFGKTLFTSILENYYDKSKIECFEKIIWEYIYRKKSNNEIKK